MRASLYEQDGDLKLALQDLDKSLELYPEALGTRWYRANLRLKTGDVRVAIADCNVGMAKHQTNSYINGVEMLMQSLMRMIWQLPTIQQPSGLASIRNPPCTTVEV